jgi:hypothetical protein
LGGKGRGKKGGIDKIYRMDKMKREGGEEGREEGKLNREWTRMNANGEGAKGAGS